jgi:hypothetical protein
VRSVRPRLEALEERTVPNAYTPLEVRHAYGFDRVRFAKAGSPHIAGDGTGQTIAVIIDHDDPNIASDLATFDSIYGLPAPLSFKKVNQTGGTTYPTPDAGSAEEIALDVEYAHAMAPGANILLVEATTDDSSDLDAAGVWAMSQPGVTVVSRSTGQSEKAAETGRDGNFVHAGVTYLAASGDGGAPGVYPAFSPNVVAVGGTWLFLDANGNYSGESGWSGSGGGISQYESQPSYQKGVVTQSTTQRCIPDISITSGLVMIYNSYAGAGGLHGVKGTSASTPMLAGLTAVVNQGRSYLGGRSSYTGTDFLNALYHLPPSDLNDITTGNNGIAASPGYDLVTGRGTPIVDRFVSAMIGAPVDNALNGQLLVTVGGHGSSDTITLSKSGGQLVVQVSSSIPLAGSGIPTNQTFHIDTSQYSSVTISTSDGSTTVNIDSSTDATVNLIDHGNTTVYVGSGGNSVNVWETSSGTTTTINGSSNTIVNIGQDSQVQNIQGTVTIANPLGLSTVNINDTADSTSRTAWVDQVNLNGAFYERVTGLSLGAIQVQAQGNNAAGLTVNTGSGGVTVNVLATRFFTWLYGHGATTVNVGSGSSLAYIQGTLTINNYPPSFTTVVLDDSADGTNHDGVSQPKVAITADHITGLAPAPVNFLLNTIDTLTVKGGGGNNTYTISGTPAAKSMTLDTGSGTDTVNVQAASVPLTINTTTGNGGFGNNQVSIGSAGSMAGLTAAVTVYNGPSRDQLTIDESADSAKHANVAISASGITGLAPQPLNFTAYSISALTVKGGSNSNTYTISDTPAAKSMTLDTGGGVDTVNVQATSAPLTVTTTTGAGGSGKDVVTFGKSGNLAALQGAVTVSNLRARDQLTIDDSADSTNHPSVAISASGITGLAAALNFTAASISTLTVKGGGGNNTYTISGTPATTSMTLDTGGGTDTVNVQAASAPLTINTTTGSGGKGNDQVTLGNAGSLAGLTAAVTVYNGASRDQLTIDDSADSTKHPKVAITGSGITGLTTQPLNFTAYSISTLTVKGGSNSNTYTISGTPAATSVSLNTGTGYDTVNIQVVSVPLTVTTSSVGFLGRLFGTNVISLGNVGGLAGIQAPVTLSTATRLETVVPTIALTVDDSGDTLPISYTLSANSLIWQEQWYLPFPPPLVLSYHGLKSLLLKGGQSKTTLSVASPVPTFPVTYHGGAGPNTLIGPNGPSTWGITGSNAGTLGHVTFTGVANLTGGSDNDTFQFQPSGSLSGAADGGGGSNTLDFSALPTASVVVSLKTLSASINGSKALSFAHMQTLTGSPNAWNYDTLLGPDGDITWTLNGPNAGQVGAVNFNGFGDVQGGSGANVYQFQPHSSVLTIVGGTAPANEGNWLDYSAFPANTLVTVNLTRGGLYPNTGSATNVGIGISGIQNVRGGNGGNTLTGNSQGNILVGGSGADVLKGGSGVSLLIGGLGADQLKGGSGGDLLIGGFTDFDSNKAALMSLLAEWQSNNPYVVRISYLTMGAGLNGANKLLADSTVHDDGAADSLTGGAALTAGALDWFFKDPKDTISNYEVGEMISALTGSVPASRRAPPSLADFSLIPLGYWLHWM